MHTDHLASSKTNASSLVPHGFISPAYFDLLQKLKQIVLKINEAIRNPNPISNYGSIVPHQLAKRDLFSPASVSLPLRLTATIPQLRKLKSNPSTTNKLKRKFKHPKW
ncbi:hypothetical protein QQ045_024200 [Rhodiola kirilowii]